MISTFDSLRNITILSVLTRLLLATLCGGIIGAERETKRRPAGFRTHILICIGATMTTLTSQYLYSNMGYYTDIGRLGAQVVAGVGFIGAGTIIVTRKQHIKGLTTAAGLWAVAIVGLALGSGFYEVSIIATILILLAEALFVRWDRRLLDNAPEINLYLEYNEKSTLEAILQLCRQMELSVQNMEFTRQMGSGHNAALILLLRPLKKQNINDFMVLLHEVNGIEVATEL